MRDIVGLAWMGPRWIGALAGLAPASLVVVLFVITGSATPTGGVILSLAGITVLAVLVGGIVGPLARGSFRADLMALMAYALVASLSYLLIGTVGMAWTETAARGTSELSAVAQLVAGRLLYGLLYVPFWAGFVAPFALGWVVVARVLRRRALPAPTELAVPNESGGSNRLQAIRPRRLALVTATIILGYGLFVALIPMIQDRGPRPPWAIYRPIALFGLFAVPAVVAAIGTVRGVRPLLIAAGVLCLLQAYVAFSGVTIGFVVPAIVLLWLGAGGPISAEEPRRTRATLLAGIAVIGLTVAAWVSLLALTEARCYFISKAEGGTLIYTEIPATDRMLNGPVPIIGEGGGCGSAELTVQGMGVSAVLAIGAMAFAASAAASAGRRQGPA